MYYDRHLFMYVLYTLQVFVHIVHFAQICVICMHILCHSCLYKVLYLRGLVVSIMYVYGAHISCLCVTHLNVPTFLLYIHSVRYASLLFISPVYIFFFYAVILSLFQIMSCISVCKKFVFTYYRIL